MAMLVAGSFAGINTVFSGAADASNYTIVSGSAVADPSTADIKAGFKVDGNFSEVYDGKIVADKTVKYGSDNYSLFSSYDDDEFSVELSALAQSYVSTVNTTVTSVGAVHPDVVFVVDLSSSMRSADSQIRDGQGNVIYDTRAEGTVVAMNNAIKSLMDSDPQTRIGIVSFNKTFGAVTTGDGKGSDSLYLPLDTYTLPEGTSDYLFFDETLDEKTIQIPDGLELIKARIKDGDSLWFYPDSGTKSSENSPTGPESKCRATAVSNIMPQIHPLQQKPAALRMQLPPPITMITPIRSTAHTL